MKKIIVKKEYSGKKAMDVICAYFPEVKPSVFLKAFDKKNIKINSKSIKENVYVFTNDEISIFVPDNVFASKKVLKPDIKSTYEIVFKDSNILLVNKPSGIAVHGGETTSKITLIDQIKKDFKNDQISLGHRLDMNTGGLLMLAQNKETLEEILYAFKNNLIIKRYHCLVKGVPTVGQPVICHDNKKMYQIKAYLEKSKSRVFVNEASSPGSLSITTRYKVEKIFKRKGPQGEDVSLLEVELVTGRTHQIRAHLSFLGHPIIGDGKYGENSFNKFFEGENGKIKTQQLFAVSLHFRDLKQMKYIGYLSAKSFVISPNFSISW